MPELIEVELYRRLAEPLSGRTIERVDAPDSWYCKGSTSPDALTAALSGATVVGLRRIGKLLLVDLDGVSLGLRFGMTGRLLVDGGAAIERLEYSSDRNDPAWDRFAVGFVGGGELVVRDPRRLGGVELDPDESRLGPDAAAVDGADLARVLARSSAPLKARLLDQSRLAGVGNLICDETLWRAGLDPRRPSGSIRPVEIETLAQTLVETIAELTARGGSHTGDLHEQRHRQGICPRDGVSLRRDTIGGRTTFWCPSHQL